MCRCFSRLSCHMFALNTAWWSSMPCFACFARSITPNLILDEMPFQYSIVWMSIYSKWLLWASSKSAHASIKHSNYNKPLANEPAKLDTVSNFDSMYGEILSRCWESYPREVSRFGEQTDGGGLTALCTSKAGGAFPQFVSQLIEKLWQFWRYPALGLTFCPCRMNNLSRLDWLILHTPILAN